VTIHDDQGHKIEDWRVVADHGTERVRATQYEPGDCEAWPGSSGTSGRRGSGTTMRGAVTNLADEEGWSVREILAPDERTREEAIAEAVREEREACAKTCVGRAEMFDALAAEDCDLDDPGTAEDYGRFREACHLAEAIRARST
jgi:hypothetical protein